MVSLGAPVKLQSVPYALFAMATPRVKGTNKNAEQDSPIFEVLNSKGTQVFGVYEGGVRFNVMEDDGTRGPRGGFAVATMRASGMRGEADAINRLMITGPRFDVTVDPVTRGPRGGFAVSSRSFGNAFGTRGAAGTLPLFNVDDQASYFTQISNRMASVLSFRDRQRTERVLMNLTSTGEIYTPSGIPTAVIKQIPNDGSQMALDPQPLELSEASRWLLPQATYNGTPEEYTLELNERVQDRFRVVKILSTKSIGQTIERPGLEYYADKVEAITPRSDTINNVARVCLVLNPQFCRNVSTKIVSRKVSSMSISNSATITTGRLPTSDPIGASLNVKYYDGANEIPESEALLLNMPFTVQCSEAGVSVERISGRKIWVTATKANFDAHAKPNGGGKKEVNVTLNGKWLPGGTQTFKVQLVMVK